MKLALPAKPASELLMTPQHSVLQKVRAEQDLIAELQANHQIVKHVLPDIVIQPCIV